MLAGYGSRIPIARWLTYVAVLSLIIAFVDMLHVRRDIAEDLNRYFGTRYTIMMSTFVHPWFQYVFNCYALYARGITTFGPVERDLSSKVAKNFYQHVSWRLNTTMQASQNTTIYQNITITIESLIQEAVYKVYTAAFAIGLYYMYGLWEQHVRLRLSHSVNRLTTLMPSTLMRVIPYANILGWIVCLAVPPLVYINRDNIMEFTKTLRYQNITTMQDRYITPLQDQYISRAVGHIFTVWIAITLYVLVREPDNFPHLILVCHVHYTSKMVWMDICEAISRYLLRRASTPLSAMMFIFEGTWTPLAHQLTRVLIMFNFYLAETLNSYWVPGANQAINVNILPGPYAITPRFLFHSLIRALIFCSIMIMACFPICLIMELFITEIGQWGAQMLWISLAATLNLLLDLPRLALLALIPESFGYSRTLFGTTDFRRKILRWLMVLAALMPQFRYLGRHEIPMTSSYWQLGAKLIISVVHLYIVALSAFRVNNLEGNKAEAIALTITEAYLLYTVFQHLSVQIVQHDEHDHHKPLALPGDVIRRSLPETVSVERKPYVFVVLLVMIILVPLLIALIICSRRPRGAIDGHNGHDDGDDDNNDGDGGDDGDDDNDGYDRDDGDNDDNYRYDRDDGRNNSDDSGEDDNSDDDSDDDSGDDDSDPDYVCDGDDDDDDDDEGDDDDDEGDDDDNNLDDLSLTDRLVRWFQQQHDERSGLSLQKA